MKREIVAVVVVVLGLAALQGPQFAKVPVAQTVPLREMALTFDDLPYASATFEAPVATARAQRVTSALLDTLMSHSAPAVAFVNEGKLGAGADRESNIALLQKWVDAGAVLGNHTFSHPDFNTITVEEIRDEIVKGEIVTRLLMQSRRPYQLYFRYPGSHTGDTVAKKEAIEQFLTARGYEIAPLTIDSSDYIFNVGYVQALNNNDQAMTARVRAAYLDFVLRATEFVERISPQMFGRAIPQTIVLHANDISADSLDELLTRLRERGYRFVSLDKALSDSAYKTKDSFVTRLGPTWLWRWRQSLGLTVSFRDDLEPPAWILDLYNSSAK
jgi:peptidoglycan/xylan/chitin deacetylase (PgdA/CDA1 family)